MVNTIGIEPGMAQPLPDALPQLPELQHWVKARCGLQFEGQDAPKLLRAVQQRSQALGKALKIEWRGSDSLRFSGQAPFDGWINLLGELHRDFGLIVRQAQVTAAAPGLVNIDAELQLARSAQ